MRLIAGSTFFRYTCIKMANNITFLFVLIMICIGVRKLLPQTLVHYYINADRTID